MSSYELIIDDDCDKADAAGKVNNAGKLIVELRSIGRPFTASRQGLRP